MENCICRALTFISYHIPLSKSIDVSLQYKTIGFFDGLFTEKLKLNYEQEDLHALWKYTLKRTEENKGYYSFQNIFGISMDEWNDCTDEYFWSEKANRQFPLTFVIFMQLSSYMSNEKSIQNQCVKFNKAVNQQMDSDGLSYVYGTVDKNDFIVCIKCKSYKNAVKAIKSLHDTGENVVYSYSIFSIGRDILEEIKTDKQKYQYIFDEIIDSICFKGVTNSCDLEPKVTLDRKYYEFCKKLVKGLYGDGIEELDGEKPDRKLYDILGDDDFRLIARDVSLGNLLKEFASGGMLCYTEKEFPFYLFSSSLILNTLTVSNGEKKVPIELKNKNKWFEEREDKSATPFCSNLEQKMINILNVVSNACYEDEKIVTFSQAVFQLLQSLKVLERAPTKRYDFVSLYHPFAVLVNILESKLNKQLDKQIEKYEKIGEKEEIYDFIHTISMTLHGTLRTDIQFFQIKDFNVITHYAPAKLRAFYSMWALKLSNYYNMFGNNQRKYSFIVAPGMYKGTEVKQLFGGYEEQKQLMLITIPERHLYSVKWLSVILAHEVSHFVGKKVRNRFGRYKSWSNMIMRILELELHSYTYTAMSKLKPLLIEEIIKENGDLFKPLEEEILEQSEEVCKEKEGVIDKSYLYHSENAFEIIKLTHRKVLKIHFKQIIYDYCYSIKEFIREKSNQTDTIPERNLTDGQLTFFMNKLSKEMIVFYELFQRDALKGLLGIIQNITTETFADMMAILTLGLSPKQYIKSFIKSEMNPYVTDELDEKEGTAVFIRIAIVMQAVSNVAKKYRLNNKKYLPELLEAWSEDTLKTCFIEFSLSSREGKVVAKALGYRDKITSFHRNISTYMRLYNLKQNRFTNDTFNFLEDEVFWNNACSYLEQCADIYIKELDDNSNVKKARMKLLNSFKKISGDSCVQLMQEIEDFLLESENLLESEK